MASGLTYQQILAAQAANPGTIGAFGDPRLSLADALAALGSTNNSLNTIDPNTGRPIGATEFNIQRGENGEWYMPGVDYDRLSKNNSGATQQYGADYLLSDNGYVEKAQHPLDYYAKKLGIPEGQIWEMFYGKGQFDPTGKYYVQDNPGEKGKYQDQIASGITAMNAPTGVMGAINNFANGGGLVALAAAGLGGLAYGGGALGYGAEGLSGAAGGLSAADTLGLQQMGQAAGLQGAALDSFVASGGTLGSTAAGGGGIGLGASAADASWGVNPSPGASGNPYQGLNYSPADIEALANGTYAGAEQTAAQSASQLGSSYGLTQQGGLYQMLADAGVPTNILQNTSLSNLNSLRNLLPSGGSGGNGMTTQSTGNSTLDQLLGLGASTLPSLLAWNYFQNLQKPDVSAYDALINQAGNMSGPLGQFDLNTGTGRSALNDSLTARGVAGSSFGDQALTNYNTQRDLGRGSLAYSGLGTKGTLLNSKNATIVGNNKNSTDFLGRLLGGTGSALGANNANGATSGITSSLGSLYNSLFGSSGTGGVSTLFQNASDGISNSLLSGSSNSDYYNSLFGAGSSSASDPYGIYQGLNMGTSGIGTNNPLGNWLTGDSSGGSLLSNLWGW